MYNPLKKHTHTHTQFRYLTKALCVCVCQVHINVPDHRQPIFPTNEVGQGGGEQRSSQPRPNQQTNLSMFLLAIPLVTFFCDGDFTKKNPWSWQNRDLQLVWVFLKGQALNHRVLVFLLGCFATWVFRYMPWVHPAPRNGALPGFLHKNIDTKIPKSTDSFCLPGIPGGCRSKIWPFQNSSIPKDIQSCWIWYRGRCGRHRICLMTGLLWFVLWSGSIALWPFFLYALLHARTDIVKWILETLLEGLQVFPLWRISSITH